MEPMPSEVAAIRQQIEHEYLAGQLGLSGLAAGVSRHQWITQRQERLGVLHEQLQGMIGEQAIVLVAETLHHTPDCPTRQQVQQVLLHEFGSSTNSEHLLEEIQTLWQQVDRLSERVGVEAAHKIMRAQPTQGRLLPS